MVRCNVSFSVNLISLNKKRREFEVNVSNVNSELMNEDFFTIDKICKAFVNIMNEEANKIAEKKEKNEIKNSSFIKN